MKNNEILKSNSCAAGFSTENQTGIFIFNGDLYDENNNLLNKDYEYKITVPIDSLKDIVGLMIKIGVEYQKETLIDVGFPDLDEDGDLNE